MPPTTSSLKTHTGGSKGSPGGRGGGRTAGFRSSRTSGGGDSAAAGGRSSSGGRRRIPDFSTAFSDGFDPNRSRHLNLRDRQRFGLGWQEDEGEGRNGGGRRGRHVLATPMHVQQSSEVRNTIPTVVRHLHVVIHGHDSPSSSA